MPADIANRPHWQVGSDTDDTRLRVCFVILQALGHVTIGMNLRSGVTALNRVDARWLMTTLSDRHPWLDRISVLPNYLQAGARGLVEVNRALRDSPTDVLVFDPQNAAMLCQWQLHRYPSILMTDLTPLQHDRLGAAYRHQADRNGLARALKHRVNILNYRLADAVVALSSWVRDSLVNDYYVPADHVHVIPTGVDITRWLPGPRNEARDRVKVLFVGNDFDRKGGSLLLDVFRELGLHHTARLDLVTQEMLPAVEGVVVHRNLPNGGEKLLQLYRDADVFALPTMADGLPAAAIEAASTGLPIIASDIAGLPDVVQHGQTGLLVRPGNKGDLAEALVRLLTDPDLRQRLGRAGRRGAIERFDSVKNASRILDLVHRVAAERAQAHRVQR